MTYAQSEESSRSLVELVAAFADIGKRVSAQSSDLQQGLVEVAAEIVPGVDFASLTVVVGSKRFRTSAATDDRARAADQLQYDFGSGPCVDAAMNESVYHPSDLRHDRRWPEFGRRVVDDLGIHSMLAYRLTVDGGDLRGALNLYAETPAAFDERSCSVGLLLATHGGAIIELDQQTKKAGHLEKALETSREIGIGIGVLMALHKITREAAFDLLRIASQHTNRKLRDLAVEVAETGTLPATTGR